jgi:hypothetical protein
MRFIVCPDCGNKRCPKANDHRNACTNSNEVGQHGSSWEHVKSDNDQPGACAPVPLPEHVGIVERWHDLYGQSVVPAYTADQLRAYGEACAAREAAKYQATIASATATMMDGARAVMQLGRERDEQRARAEAAEAKVAEMGG